MKVTMCHHRMYEFASSVDWFTSAELAEKGEVSKATANRFISYLLKQGAIERIEVRPAPLIRVLKSPQLTEDGKRFIANLHAISSALSNNAAA